MLAILADFKEKSPEAVIRLILQRLKEVSLNKAELKKYFNQLTVLSRLRNLSKEVTTNIAAMPITIDIEKDYLYKQGKEKGEAQKTRESTINLLQEGMDISFICRVLKVSKEYVQEIRKETGL